MTQDEVDKYCESVKPNNKSHRKLKHSVGINDLPHITGFKDRDGKSRHHSGYSQWDKVLTRCYSEKKKLEFPTYVGVTLCDEWKYASNFIAWQKTQYRENGWELDKDLLVVGNKVYSPETCLYIPSWLNTFTLNNGRARGDCLIGVCKGGRRYRANCSNPITGKGEHLGRFTSELEAHLAWRKRKLELALELKPRMDEIDLRIYPNVVIIIGSLG